MVFFVVAIIANRTGHPVIAAASGIASAVIGVTGVAAVELGVATTMRREP
jgi:uncharacterized membrane protein YtjA (UPF0391 family)